MKYILVDQTTIIKKLVYATQRANKATNQTISVLTIEPLIMSLIESQNALLFKNNIGYLWVVTLNANFKRRLAENGQLIKPIYKIQLRKL